MTDKQKQQRIEEALRAKFDEMREMDEALTTRKEQPIVGDILSFPDLDLPEDLILYWAVLKKHPDEDAYALVACDPIDWEGTSDLRISKMERFGNVTLRLGEVLWVNEFPLKKAKRIGFLDDFSIEQANFILHKIVVGEWRGFEKQRRTDALEEYVEYIQKIRGAVEGLVDYLESERVEEILSVQDWQRKLADWLANAGKTLKEKALAKLSLPEPAIAYGAGEIQETLFRWHLEDEESERIAFMEIPREKIDDKNADVTLHFALGEDDRKPVVVNLSGMIRPVDRYQKATFKVGELLKNWERWQSDLPRFSVAYNDRSIEVGLPEIEEAEED